MMNMQPHSQQLENEGEISLFDTVRLFQKNWKWLIGSTSLGLFGGLAYVLTAQELYEANASLQMSVVANAQIETPAALVEKMKSPTFYSEEIISACGIKESPQRGLSLAEALKPTVNSYMPVVQLKFRANSPLLAKTCLEKVFEYVKTEQQEIAMPILEAKKAELKRLEQRLSDATKFQTANKNYLSSNVTDQKFSASMYYLALTDKKRDEIVSLTENIANLKLLLEAPHTVGTKLLIPIYSPEVRVFPKRTFITMSAAFGGFFIGIAILLLAGVWTSSKQRSASKHE